MTSKKDTISLFYDSYAILEYINGNTKYAPYFEEREGITTFYNAMEVYYIVLREEGEEKARKILEAISTMMIMPEIDDIAPAMKLRLEKKEQRLSYADCLGYVIARKRNIKFLTGDKEFKGLPNVEFVK